MYVCVRGGGGGNQSIFFFNTGATFSALTEGPSLLSSSPSTIMGLSG